MRRVPCLLAGLAQADEGEALPGPLEALEEDEQLEEEAQAAPATRRPPTCHLPPAKRAERERADAIVVALFKRGTPSQTEIARALGRELGGIPMMLARLRREGKIPRAAAPISPLAKRGRS